MIHNALVGLTVTAIFLYIVLSIPRVIKKYKEEKRDALDTTKRK